MWNMVGEAVRMLEGLIEILIFLRILVSWVPFVGNNNPVISYLYAMTEPILSPIRDIIRKSPISGVGMVIDFSPVVALLLLRAIVSILGF